MRDTFEDEKRAIGEKASEFAAGKAPIFIVVDSFHTHDRLAGDTVLRVAGDRGKLPDRTPHLPRRHAAGILRESPMGTRK